VSEALAELSWRITQTMNPSCGGVALLRTKGAIPGGRSDPSESLAELSWRITQTMNPSCATA
jgi:hypothetical protein